MYQDSLDEQEWSYGCHFSQAGNIDTDYAIHLQQEQDAAIRAYAERTQLAILIIQDSGFPAPNAGWRRKIADLTKTREFKGICCAIVTTNALIRGVVTALNWIRVRDYQEVLFEDTRSAIAWLEMSCGRPLPALRQVVNSWVTNAAAPGKTREAGPDSAEAP